MIKDLKGICNLQLNSISSIDNDPTLLKLTFSILDFEVSGNKQIVSKELASEASPTLSLKPLLCQYFPTTNYEQLDDHFGSHGQYKTKDRYGNDVIATNTIAVGTSNESGAYFGTIKDENDNDVEVLMCDFYLWVDKYTDIANLINEMWQAGIPLKSSCEYLYKNFKVENGITYIQSPLIFTGHCLLKSNENNMGEVLPAYDSSKLISFNERFEKAISEAIQNHNSQIENVDINNKQTQKEVNEVMENKFYVALCELSFGDIREQIMATLLKTMTAEEFQYVWISNYGIYDTYFVYENYEDGKYVNYKVPYSKTETDIVVDLASKVAVERDMVWVEVGTMESTVNELNNKIEVLTIDITTANETINTLTTEKSDLETKFNNASEIILTLNSTVEELKPLVEQFNSEKIEKSINEKIEFYGSKFKALNAMEKFESEEIQNLIKLSINDNDEGKDAILSLNSTLVELVSIKPVERFEIKEIGSKNENLIPTAIDFDSRYSD